MKHLSFILLLTSSTSSFAQINNYDSLKKYSYSLLGFTITHNGEAVGMKPGGGTCFFIRDNGKLFLVTAKHVLSGCLENAIKITDYPNQMNICFADSNGYIEEMIPFDISRIKDSIQCLPSLDDTDVIVVPMNIKTNREIYSVEKFIFPPFREIDNVDIFGFPGNKNINFLGFASVRAKVFHWHLFKNHTTVFTETTFNDSKRTDSVYYWIQTTDIDVMDSSLHGFSGSPVFIKDLNSDRWRVGGVYKGAAKDTISNNKWMLVTRIEYALKYIY